MALTITKVADKVFTLFEDNEYIDGCPGATAVGDFIDFKTENGAKLVSKVNYADITIIDNVGGGGPFTFASSEQVMIKLSDLGYFKDGDTSGGVQSITGNIVNNSDPQNPIINETITQIQNTIGGAKIADYTNESGVITDINQTVTSFFNLIAGNRIATYTNEGSGFQDINETVTDLLYDSQTGVLTYNRETLLPNTIQLSTFGFEFQRWTQFSLITTTIPLGVNIFNVNTSAISGGDYIMILSFNISTDSTNSDGIVNITFDGSPLTPTTGNNEMRRLEMKDSGGNNPPGAGTNQKELSTLIFPLIGLTSGSKNINVSIAPETAGVECNMWNASLMFFKSNN